MKHIKVNIFLVLALVFILACPYIAEARAIPKLEVTYPSLPPFAKTTQTTPIAPGAQNSLSIYIVYAFVFIIVLSAIIAVVMIAIGGVEYIYSAGNPGVMGNAKSKIASSTLGLVILACSYLILTTINPNLIVITDPQVKGTVSEFNFGVWACKERVDFKTLYNESRSLKNEVSGATSSSELSSSLKSRIKTYENAREAIFQYCYLVQTAGGVNKSFENKIKFFYLVPEYNVREFGVIAYRPGEGKAKSIARVIYGNPNNYNPELTQPIEWRADGKADYLRPFELVNRPPTDWYADIYEMVHQNQGASDAKKYRCQTGGKRETWCDLSSLSPKPDDSSSPGDNQTPISLNSDSLGIILSQSDSTTPIEGEVIEIEDENNNPTGAKPPKISSVDFNGNLFIVFFRDSISGWGSTAVIDVAGPSSEANLYSSYMGGWNEACIEKNADAPNKESYYPCAWEALMISAKFM